MELFREQDIIRYLFHAIDKKTELTGWKGEMVL